MSPPERHPCVLGIFAKQPIEGHVKTRLAQKTNATFAARVAEAFLRDTIAKFATLAAERWLVYASATVTGSLHPAPAKSYFERIGAGRYRLEAQDGYDLGERLSSFFKRRFDEGARRVMAIGTDSPTLPPEYVERAFAALGDTSIVLGPATDGGYYLVGCTPPLPPIFDGISWGAAAVLAQTVERARSASLRLTVLPPWYDIDTLNDWRVLAGHCRAMRLAGVDPGAPATEELLGDESSASDATA